LPGFSRSGAAQVQGQFQTTQACGQFEAVDAEQLRGPTNTFAKMAMSRI
jgi:hypothetical protein